MHVMEKVLSGCQQRRGDPSGERGDTRGERGRRLREGWAREACASDVSLPVLSVLGPTWSLLADLTDDNDIGKTPKLLVS